LAERISEAELVVMEVLWSAQASLTASEITHRVDPGRAWSDRTVKTMLARLLAKGVIAHEEDGRRYLYRPAVARELYVARESRRLVDKLFGGRAAPMVAHLAQGDGLSSDDIAELKALLNGLQS
jgi:BlaI family transcriptional regulator, penicillinase repressor